MHFFPCNSLYLHSLLIIIAHHNKKIQPPKNFECENQITWFTVIDFLSLLWNDYLNASWMNQHEEEKLPFLDVSNISMLPSPLKSAGTTESTFDWKLSDWANGKAKLASLRPNNTEMFWLLGPEKNTNFYNNQQVLLLSPWLT